MTTAYITHAECLRHEMGAGHPENPERLNSVNEHMRLSGILPELRCLEAPLADHKDLKRVHRAAYVDLIFEHAPKEGYVQLDLSRRKRCQVVSDSKCVNNRGGAGFW